MNKEIDLVVPYVDCEDENGLYLYNKYNTSENNTEINSVQRFRGQGDFFKYFFRCVGKNMPFIRKVFLVVQSKSQVPSGINRETVTVVLHEDFIPHDILPVFNSTAIEMFIPFIPGLSEKFIYANDDLLVNNLTKENFFFDGNTIRTNGRYCGDLNTMYGHHIVNSYRLIYGDYDPSKGCPGFSHVMRPLLKSKCIECFNKYEEEILNSITKFRDTKNYNVYIYDHYMMKYTQIKPKLNIFDRTISGLSSDKYIAEVLNDPYCNMINVCDNTDDIDIYKNKILNSYFVNRYKFRSIYEK